MAKAKKADDTNVEAAALSCLAELVEQLVDRAGPAASTDEWLLAYQVLSRLKGNAKASGVPLAAIGLDKLDPETLLVRPRKAA